MAGLAGLAGGAHSLANDLFVTALGCGVQLLGRVLQIGQLGLEVVHVLPDLRLGAGVAFFRARAKGPQQVDLGDGLQVLGPTLQRGVVPGDLALHHGGNRAEVQPRQGKPGLAIGLVGLLVVEVRQGGQRAEGNTAGGEAGEDGFANIERHGVFLVPVEGLNRRHHSHSGLALTSRRWFKPWERLRPIS